MKASAETAAIEPLKREKVSDVAVQVIRDYIVRNGLKPGDRLPSERALATSLNVGTRSIREALRNLEARGVVRIEHGKGAFVEERYRDDMAQFLADSLELGSSRDQKMLLELMYVRSVIETGIIGDVVSGLSAETARQLSEILLELERAAAANDIEEYNRWDIRLHKAIVGATGNSILTSLYERMRDLFDSSFARTGNLPGSLTRSLREHTELVGHITSGNADGARALIAAHLEHTTASLRSLLSRVRKGKKP